MKKSLYLCLSLLIVLSLAACGGKADEPDTPPEADTVASEVKTPEPVQEPEPEPEPPIPFTDVPEDAAYYNTVVWAYEKGIVSDGDTFEPDSACTRGQVITFLWRAKGSPEPQTEENPFGDVSSTAWYYKPALWAYENGIASGTAFSADNSCTNAEVLTFLWRAEGKPAASVYNSDIALAASGEYYTRPAAWAENNGMFDGMDAAFDPAAPCLRSDIVTYLYWATEQWTFTEEDKAVQAEYEQIVSDAQLYEVHGSGLCYADYIDADGDGKVELLTMDTGENLVDTDIAPGKSHYDMTATVYATTNGHVEKVCAYTFDPRVDYAYTLYLCTYGDAICFRAECGMRMYGEHDEYYTFENNDIVYSEYADCLSAQSVVEYQNMAGSITEAEYNAIRAGYTNQKQLFLSDCSAAADGVTVYDRGLLPSPAEYWEANRDQIYAAVLEGDFSYFAGYYTGKHSDWEDQVNISAMLKWYRGLECDFGWGDVINLTPVSVTIEENGSIYCLVQPIHKEYEEDGGVWQTGSYFTIYPINVAYDAGDLEFSDMPYGTDEVRIEYVTLDGYSYDKFQFHLEYHEVQ